MSAYSVERVPYFRTTSTATPLTGLGTTGISFKIPNVSGKRLVKAELHMNVTFSAAMVAGTNGSSFRGENLVKKAVVKLSDLEGSTREHTNCTGAQLFEFNRIHSKTTSEAQQTVWGSGVTGSAQTIDYILPIHFMHPASDLPQGYIQCVPMTKRVSGSSYGLGDEPEFIFDLATLDDEFLGLKTGTVTVNRYCLWLYFIKEPPVGSAGALPQVYVPSELTHTEFNNGATTQSNVGLAVPKNGLLTSITLLTYSAGDLGTLGEVLSNGLDGYYQVRVNGSVTDTFTQVMAKHDQELWKQAYPTDTAPGLTHNTSKWIFTVNFWHNMPEAGADNANSVPTLYTENRGDLIEIVLDKWAASTRVQFLTHKFLVTNPRLLTTA